jgi:hypothetical protein
MLTSSSSCAWWMWQRHRGGRREDSSSLVKNLDSVWTPVDICRSRRCVGTPYKPPRLYVLSGGPDRTRICDLYRVKVAL